MPPACQHVTSATVVEEELKVDAKKCKDKFEKAKERFCLPEGPKQYVIAYWRSEPNVTPNKRAKKTPGSANKTRYGSDSDDDDNGGESDDGWYLGYGNPFSTISISKYISSCMWFKHESSLCDLYPSNSLPFGVE